jgi:succinate-acetate transporter protein
MTTFVLSVFNANLVNAKGLPVVLGLALAYGGIVQLVAGIWEFRNSNTFGAVAFCSYGGFWLSFWALNVFYAKDIGGNAGHAVGLYLWSWAIFTAYMTVASLRVSVAVFAVFALLTATFILLAIGASGHHTTVTHWGGYVGIATAAAAWYASFAVVVNSTFRRTLMPTFPLSPGGGGGGGEGSKSEPAIASATPGQGGGPGDGPGGPRAPEVGRPGA